MKVVSIHKVIEAAGGAARLQTLMIRAHQPYPDHQRIGNWKRRGQIPGSWVGAVMWALACKGVNPIDLLSDTRG
jgi:hypothetical protein